jgi:hypothetical protein
LQQISIALLGSNLTILSGRFSQGYFLAGAITEFQL